MILYFLFVSSLFIFSEGVPAHEGLKEVIDLTHDFDNETIYWRGVTNFHFTKKMATQENGIFYAMNEFEAGEHGGTHLDAPYHFSKYGKTIEQIPIEDLIVKGIVVDISDDVEEFGGDAVLKVSHLEDWVKKHGPIPNRSVILVRTCWSKFWPDKQLYFGTTHEEPDKFNFPGLSKEAAQWIIDTNKVLGVGIDTASIDPGSSTTFDAHVLLQGKGFYLMENLDISDELPAKKFTLFIFPMKIKDGTGAPLRIVATPEVNFLK